MAKYVRILSIDGGGIRGIIPGEILVSVEKKLQQKSGNPDAKIADYFDLIAGTSTGGILTCLYLTPDRNHPTRPRCSAREAVNFYLNRGSQVFSKPFWRDVRTGFGVVDEKFPSTPLESLLAEFFQDLPLNQLIKPCLIPAYNIEERKAHFFTQHDAKAYPYQNFWVRDVARATSAAPTFFEVSLVKAFAKNPTTSKNVYPLIDGGVFANNPALCAYAEVRTKKLNPTDLSSERPTAKDMVFLSLGTGKINKRYNYQDAKDWGVFQWVRPLFNIIMSGVDETVDYQLIQIFNSIEKPEQYLRLNPEIPADSPMSEMDNGSDSNIQELRNLGVQTAISYNKKLDEFIEKFLLV